MKSKISVLVVVAVVVGWGAVTVTAGPQFTTTGESKAANAHGDQPGQDGPPGKDRTNVRVDNLTIENLTLSNVTVTNPRAMNATVQLQPGGERRHVPAARADLVNVSANLTNVTLENVRIRNETLARELLGFAGENQRVTEVHLGNVTLNNTTVSGAMIQNATVGNVSIEEYRFTEKKGPVPQRGPPAIQAGSASVETIAIDNITIVDFQPETVLTPRDQNE